MGNKDMVKSKKILYKFTISVLLFLIICTFSLKSTAETPAQIGFHGDYSSLAELIGLLEQSNQDIDNKIKEIEESYIDHPYCYFANFDMSINVEKRADLELLFQIFQKPYFPVIKDAKPIEVELYYIFYEEYWVIRLTYEIRNIVYSSSVSEEKSANVMREFADGGYWEFELLKDNGDIRIFLQKPRNPDDTRIIFGLDVKELWVTTSVSGTNDINFALDELSAFCFESFNFDNGAISEIAPATGDNSIFFIVVLNVILFLTILTKNSLF